MRRPDGRGDPEAYEDAAAEPALEAGDATRAAQAVGHRAGGEGVQAVARKTEAGEADAEHKHLQPHVAGVRIDELRDEREDEDDRLRVRQVDDDALRIGAAERARRPFLFKLISAARQQAANPEDDE